MKFENSSLPGQERGGQKAGAFYGPSSLNPNVLVPEPGPGQQQELQLCGISYLAIWTAHLTTP